MFNDMEFIKQAETFLRVSFLGVFGAVAKYLYDVTNDKKNFTWFSFLSFCLMAAFASNVTNEFIPQETQYRDGIIMMVGYSCLQVLGAFENHVTQYIKKTKG